MSKVIGIDLGTTNSVVTVMEGGTPQVIPNQEGARTTPSVVAFAGSGERLVGQVAFRQAAANPENTVYGVKRLVGRRFDSPEARAARELAPYRIVEASNGDAHIQVQDRTYSPPEIEAVILHKLKAAAEDYLGEAVEEAIISVPAYFNDSQRQATKDAGTIAGLKVRRILNEATAASLAYGMSESVSGKIAVYDLGGGTFDISILELQDGLFQVLATGGDTYLGGLDFDELIMRWMIEEFKEQADIDLTEEPTSLQRLREAAEKAKRELSARGQAEILLPFLSAGPKGSRNLETVLTRPKLEEMIQPMLAHTVKLCQDVLRDAGLRAQDVDGVILVGGQTRTPAVQETVHRFFGKEPNPSVNPDEVVSIGAAIQTGILQGEVTDLVLLDVTPYTLGIETRDRTFTPIVERNANIPTKKSRIFTTVVDNQTEVEVHVLQGEGTTARENTSLGRFVLDRLPPAPRGEPSIEVVFEIDVNGIVQVTARESETGRQQHITVRGASGLTEAEVEQARIETAKQERHELEIRQRDRLFSEIRGLIRGTRRTFELVEWELTPEERRRALAALRQAEQAAAGGIQELQTALSELEAAAEALGEIMLTMKPPSSRWWARWLQKCIDLWTRFWRPGEC